MAPSVESILSLVPTVKDLNASEIEQIDDLGKI
jgi:hypothetical protein